MTTDSELLQRAPKGWKKRRNTDYTWRPSDASNFDSDKSNFFAPTISISDPSYTIDDIFDEEKEENFEDGAVLTLSVDSVYFVEDEESEELKLEKETKKFLGLDEEYEFKVEVHNLTEEEAKRKAKAWMQKIQSEEELAEFIKEKRKVFYGIDTFDLTNLRVSTLTGVDEENMTGRANNVLFLSNNKDAVGEYLVDSKLNRLEDEAERKKELIEENLENRKEFVKSIDQEMINFD